MLVRNPKPEIHHTQLFTNQEGQTNEDGEERRRRTQGRMEPHGPF